METTPLQLGYLTSVYARASDTFIRNEVLELRRRGHVVRTYSIREPGEEQRQDAPPAAIVEV